MLIWTIIFCCGKKYDCHSNTFQVTFADAGIVKNGRIVFKNADIFIIYRTVLFTLSFFMQAMEQCQRKLAEWRRRNWWYTSELSKHSFLKKCIDNLQTDEDYHWCSGHQSEILKLPMLYPCECQTWVSVWFVRRMDWLGAYLVGWLIDWEPWLFHLIIMTGRGEYLPTLLY